MTSKVSRPINYSPLGSKQQEEREALVQGALAMLANDAHFGSVARHFNISEATLSVALQHYAELPWRNLKIARAESKAEKATQKRAELQTQLEKYQAMENIGTKSTETGMTYQRIRELLRIAEQEERSAQWHLERLHRSIYGASLRMETPERSYEPDPAFFKAAGELLRKVSRGEALPGRTPEEEADHEEGLARIGLRPISEVISKLASAATKPNGTDIIEGEADTNDDDQPPAEARTSAPAASPAPAPAPTPPVATVAEKSKGWLDR